MHERKRSFGPSTLRAFSVSFLALGLISFGPLSVFAQTFEAEKLAREAGEAIARIRSADSQRAKVLVFGFYRTDGRITPIGSQLTEDFVRAIESSMSQIEVLRRVDPQDRFTAEVQYPEALLDDGQLLELANRAHAHAYLVGLLFPHGQKVGLWLEIHQVEPPRMIQTNTIYFRREPSFESIFRIIVPGTQKPPSDAAVSGAKHAGRGGVGEPGCKSCPLASYTSEARNAGYQGIVVLRMVVTPEGRVSTTRVVRAAPFGLTRQALESVKKWELKPATEPDGKPVSVWVTVEVNFRLR